MKLDWYTKVILTIIALALVMNLIEPLRIPLPVEAASGGAKFGHLEVVGTIGFFDPNTGDYWTYNAASGILQRHFKLIEPGKDLERLK